MHAELCAQHHAADAPSLMALLAHSYGQKSKTNNYHCRQACNIVSTRLEYWAVQSAAGKVCTQAWQFSVQTSMCICFSMQVESQVTVAWQAPIHVTVINTYTCGGNAFIVCNSLPNALRLVFFSFQPGPANDLIVKLSKCYSVLW